MSKTSETLPEETIQPRQQVTAVEDVLDGEADDYPLTKIGKLVTDMGVSDLTDMGVSELTDMGVSDLSTRHHQSTLLLIIRA